MIRLLRPAILSFCSSFSKKERIFVTSASACVPFPQPKAYVTRDNLHQADFRNIGFSLCLIPTS